MEKAPDGKIRLARVIPVYGGCPSLSEDGSGKNGVQEKTGGIECIPGICRTGGGYPVENEGIQNRLTVTHTQRITSFRAAAIP